MAKGYHHLTRDQRYQIEALLDSGTLQKDIAAIIGVSPATISRELKNNSVKGIYTAKDAQRKARRRRREASSRPKQIPPELWNTVVSRLKLGWSPEQTAGRLKHEGMSISHESIYKWVWRDKRSGGDLHMLLRRHRKKYRKRGLSKTRHCCIPNRVDIDQRPEIVDSKTRLGDWEADTVVGKGHNGAILTLVDRASKLTKLHFLPRKTSQNVADAMVAKLKALKDFVLTITADNGGEFARHEQVSEELETAFYFSKPYHAWERGLNEHTNGLLRQYFPKDQGLGHVTQEQLEEVEYLLNNRPRKVLNYLTPLEAFEQLSHSSGPIALQS